MRYDAAGYRPALAYGAQPTTRAAYGGAADATASAAHTGAPAKSQPSFSIGEWSLNFLKGGVVDTAKSLLSPTGLLTAGALAALWIIPGTQPLAAALTPIMIGSGLLMGGGKAVLSGTSSLIKAAEGDVEGSYLDAQSAGQGVATFGLSLAGARSFYKGGGTVTVNGKAAALDPKIAHADITLKDTLVLSVKDMAGRLPRFYKDGGGEVLNASGKNMGLYGIAKNNLGALRTLRPGSTGATVAGDASATGLIRTSQPAPEPPMGNANPVILAAENAPPTSTALKVINSDGSHGGWMEPSSSGLIVSQPAAASGNTATGGSGFNFRTAFNGARERVADSFQNARTRGTEAGQQVYGWTKAHPDDAIIRGTGVSVTASQFGAPAPSPLDGQIPGHTQHG